LFEQSKQENKFMAVPRPSSGKPQDPRDQNQLDPGPIVSPKVIPDIAPISFEKFKPAKFAGRTIKAGK
jgi:hypothetical protein